MVLERREPKSASITLPAGSAYLLPCQELQPKVKAQLNFWTEAAGSHPPCSREEGSVPREVGEARVWTPSVSPELSYTGAHEDSVRLGREQLPWD